MQNFSTSSKYNRGKLVGETFWHFHFKLEENQLAPIRMNKALRTKDLKLSSVIMQTVYFIQSN